ncbi:MAG: general secretion pathway protein GspB [Pseudomonadota bacterium]
MSYILEALRKAERERNPGQAEQVQATQRPRFAQISTLNQLRRYRPAIIAGLCFSLMIALTISLFIPHPPAVAATDVAQAAAAQSATPEAQALNNPYTPMLNQVYGDGRVPTTLDDLVDAGGEATSEEYSSVGDSESAAPLGDNASLAVTDSVEESAIVEPRPQPKRAVPTTSVERLQLDPAPPPQFTKLRDMPSDYRAAFPVISLDVHSYDGAPQKRFIMIAGKRYNEGDPIPDGPRVVQIIPEGVVFEFRGEQCLFTIPH